MAILSLAMRRAGPQAATLCPRALETINGRQERPVTPGVPRRVPLPLGSRDGVDPKLVAAIDRLGQALRVQMGHVARAHGLTSTQLHLLLRLRVDPPERRRVGALAAELDVTLPTVSD